MKKTHLIIGGIVIALLATISPFTIANSGFSTASLKTNTSLGSLFENKAEKNYSYFLNSESYSELKDGSIKTYPANNTSTEKVAILIPQTHRYPGSEITDSVNNSAVIAQEQIYNIISFLKNTAGVNTIMIEGELEGKVSDDKIENISKKIQLEKQFKSDISEIKKSDNGEIDEAFYSSADKYISLIDREIILAGAPYKTKSEGTQINLFGAEDKNLMDKSTIIVRNTIYLQDRLATLKGSNKSISGNFNAGSTFSANSDIIKLLAQYKSKNTSIEKQIRLNLNKSSDIKTKNLLNDALLTYKELTQLNVKKINTNTPSRSDNPYLKINNINAIEKLIKENNQELNNVVVDQRNKQTAENFDELLDSQNTKTAMLVFGSDHQEGLIKELNARGITVIDIIPNEVNKRTQ